MRTQLLSEVWLFVTTNQLASAVAGGIVVLILGDWYDGCAMPGMDARSTVS